MQCMLLLFVTCSYLLIVYFPQGADFLEFDVHLTKDEVPVVYHDLTTCVIASSVSIGEYEKLIMIVSLLRIVCRTLNISKNYYCHGLPICCKKTFH